MSVLKKCDLCDVEYLICENNVNNQVDQNIEKAYCPVCKNEIYAKKIAGWLSVEKSVDNCNREKCVYPMP